MAERVGTRLRTENGKEMVALSCTRISHHQIGGLDGRCPEMGWEEEAKGVLDMINA